MKKVCLLLTLALGAVLVLTAGAALADQKADTMALVDQAVAMAQAKGKDAAIAAVADKKGPFVKGDLYIFAGSVDTPGRLVAHPMSPKLVGKDLSKIKDVKGKLFFIEFNSVAKDPGQGWVEYWWPKPGEKKASPKMTYIKRVPGQDLWMGCGYYLQ